ncbi:MAG: adenine-specific methyltransferase EcoRI family protein [Proteiniphilum sp.]|nr:adenine-specific methyltransferase EcoRI family protein [Proteiniphilum sp.]MDD3968271.1 adenine-specific methyltransferase EcoRI family protein [Proteiniphilum sp.]
MEKILNSNLNRAKSSKKDEFYTQYADIENEMQHYATHFAGKVIYCNCDDPRVSNFFRYFSLHFEELGLKKLIATCYRSVQMDAFSRNDAEQAICLEYEGERNKGGDANSKEVRVMHLRGDGDFRSDESVELLNQADIVVTNPPFSLFREFISQLITYEKKFIVLGNQNAIIYKEVFPFIKANRLWLGVNNGGTKWFEVPDDYEINTRSRMKTENGKKFISMGSIMWYTNLDIRKRHEELILHKRYNAQEYPAYDNYDAIEIARFSEIPMDYHGVMGVPITFLDKYNPEQFEIVGSNRGIDQDPAGIYGRGSFINGKETFKRLFIRNRKPSK